MKRNMLFYIFVSFGSFPDICLKNVFLSTDLPIEKCMTQMGREYIFVTAAAVKPFKMTCMYKGGKFILQYHNICSS